MSLYNKGDLVLLAGNPYHLGIVRADQTDERDDVLVEWKDTPVIHMRPFEIVPEPWYRSIRPLPECPALVYDIFEPTREEREAVKPQQQALWGISV